MNPIVTGILVCEIGFWVVLGAGLAARYLLRLRGLSTALLLCAPLLDLALLALITWDLLANGATAGWAHGLGAVYLGFTAAFGHRIVSRADARFAHRFAGGPEPSRPPRSGPGRLRHEWSLWGRMLLCAIIASAVLGAMVLLVGDPGRTAELHGWFGRIWLVTAVWFAGWPAWLSLAHLTSSRPSSR